MNTPTTRRFALALTVLALSPIAGCDQPPDWDAAFDVDPWQDGRRAPEAADAFAHAGTWTGVCRLPDRAPFQVELALDRSGAGALVRHDVQVEALAAAGRTRSDGMSLVEAVHEDLVFRAHLWSDEDIVVGDCFELAPSEDGAQGSDMMTCMFPELGCPASPEAYEVLAAGELVLVKTS